MEHALLNKQIPVTSLIFGNFYFENYPYRFGLGFRLNFGLRLGLGLRLKAVNHPANFGGLQ